MSGSQQSFERFCTLARLRADLALTEAEVGKKWIENQILDLERQGRVERLGQIREIRDQAHREILYARQQQRLVVRKVENIERLADRANRIFAGQRLLQPSRDWHAFWSFLNIDRWESALTGVMDRPIESTDRDPDNFIAPYRRGHEGPVATTECTATSVLGLVDWMRKNGLAPVPGSSPYRLLGELLQAAMRSADAEIAKLEERTESARAGAVERWQRAVETVLSATK